jgi:hypothetical protein
VGGENTQGIEMDVPKIAKLKKCGCMDKRLNLAHFWIMLRIYTQDNKTLYSMILNDVIAY